MTAYLWRATYHNGKKIFLGLVGPRVGGECSHRCHVFAFFAPVFLLGEYDGVSKELEFVSRPSPPSSRASYHLVS
jgi:hypothetical protein